MKSLLIVAFLNFVDSSSNTTLGSHCIWPSSSCPRTCSFFGTISGIFYSFWTINVARWNDLWIRSWICYYNGWNNSWDDPAIFRWLVFQRQNSCEIPPHTVQFISSLVFWTGIVVSCILVHAFLLIASAAMVEEMASHGSYDQTGGRRELVSSIPCGCDIQDFAISIHSLQLCSGGDKDEVLALFLGICCRNGSRILHLHLQVDTPDLTPPFFSIFIC